MANVCESIFQELNKLIEARNNLIHENNYQKQWRRLRERVDFVLSELQRSSFDAQDIAQNNLQDWLRLIVNDMQEVVVNMTLVKTPLCLTRRSVIPSCVHPKEPNLDWLNKINFKSTSTDLQLHSPRKGKTNSSGKSFWIKNCYSLNTRPQLKLS